MPVNLPKSNWLRKSNNIHYVLATHSSTLAWKIPGAEEPGELQSMGSLRVGHDWVSSLLLFIFMHWRRKWQPTPVFLPGESQGWEPRGLPSMGSHRGGHNWSDLAAAAAVNHQWDIGFDVFLLGHIEMHYGIFPSLSVGPMWHIGLN